MKERKVYVSNVGTRHLPAGEVQLWFYDEAPDGSRPYQGKGDVVDFIDLLG